MGRLEIDSQDAAVTWIDDPLRPPAAFQALDLRPLEAALLRVSLVGSAFFGCLLTEKLLAAAHASRCLVYPERDDLPFRQFRGALYSPDELFAGLSADDPASYQTTLDWVTYLTYMDPVKKRPIESSLDVILARRVHDSSISDALDELVVVQPGKVVAIMGGHDRKRSDPAYRVVARIAHALTNDGYRVVSGGGPGIMEAANLGAFLASAAVEEIDLAIGQLRVADDYKDPRWLTTGWSVRDRYLGGGHEPGTSVGIPTWFYGHEPPNPFATHIAKYFENSVREEGLLSIALGGVLFAEGNGGTVQEIFQDACQNYYRTYGSPKEGLLSPMILLDAGYWDPQSGSTVPKAKPVAPLLKVLASEKKFGDYVLVTGPLTDATVTEVLQFIRTHPPVKRD